MDQALSGCFIFLLLFRFFFFFLFSFNTNFEESGTISVPFYRSRNRGTENLSGKEVSQVLSVRTGI